MNVYEYFWSVVALWFCYRDEVFSKPSYRNSAQLKVYQIVHANNGLERRTCSAAVWKRALIIKPTLDAILTLLIWMLSSCCCHCRMFSMRYTQILMFPTSTDLPMSCTRLQSDTYSVCSSSLMGLTFCWSSRTKTEQEQEEFRGLQPFTRTSRETQE